MDSETESIGFIGLGAMGRGMALHLLKAVGNLAIHDVSPDAVSHLVSAGASACATPAQLATRCGLVFLCLPGSGEVRDVIFGPDGLASAGAQALQIVDCSTLERTESMAIADDLAAIGIGYADCPVSGLPQRADEGTLTVMFGGTGETFDRVRPYLGALASEIIHSGPVGAGQAMKSVNNIIYNINIAAICEVLPLAVAAGLDAGKLARMVSTGSSRSFAAEHFLPHIMARRFDADFPMAKAYKDITNIRQMAAETGALTPVIEAMVSTYDAALAAGYGNAPKSSMVKVYEERLGIEMRTPSPPTPPSS